MTNTERMTALRTAFDKYNWSMRSSVAPGSIKVSVFDMGNKQVGELILNEGAGYYVGPKTSERWVRDLFYKLVDETIGSKT